MACMPSSRPKPDCFTPPNGATTRTELDCRDRSKYLLARHPVAIRRFDQRAWKPEAGSDRRPALEQRRALDVVSHLVSMAGRDQRSHLGRGVLGIADPEALGGFDKQSQEAVVCRLLDQDARAGAAVLAGVSEHGARGGRSRLLQVGVREDHVRRLSAQLERHPLDGLRCTLHDPASHLGRAGEADLGHVRMCDQALPHHGAWADDYVDHALRQPSLQCELGESECRQRRQLSRFQDDRVAARERGPKLPAREHQRKVPGHDKGDHAQRLAERHVHAARNGDRLPVMLLDRA